MDETVRPWKPWYAADLERSRRLRIRAMAVFDKVERTDQGGDEDECFEDDTTCSPPPGVPDADDPHS